MKGRVRDGRLVVKVVKVEDQWADLSLEERAEVEASIEEGFRDVENGDVVDARDFLAELRAKNP